MKPDYGVDAPGVIRALVGGGLAGIALGGAGLRYGGSPFVRGAGALAAAAGAAPLGLGLSMIAYVGGGKVRLRDWMLDRIEWRGDETVLDVGAGRGLMAVGAAKRSPRGRVIAVDVWRDEDLSGNGPDALRRNAELEGVADRIQVVTADARALDLADESVDVVLSVLCIHNIEPAANRVRALREVARVLKPGGRTLIADYTATGSYARALRDAGLTVRGPLGTVGPALSPMAVVDAEKPAAA